MVLTSKRWRSVTAEASLIDVKLYKLNKSSQRGTVMLWISPFKAAPGYKRPFTIGTGNISLATNCDDVTCKGVVQTPDLQVTL